MKKGLVLVSLFLFANIVMAAPREIIIIRHGDKVLGPVKGHEYSGRYLSPKGVLRSIKFAVYYASHYPVPDFIFASRPADAKEAATETTSYRPIQTVMPLADLLTQEGHGDVVIHHPYMQKQFPALAKVLLQNPMYDQKLILICWQHGRINALTKDLGVTQSLPKWKGDNYDQVYILKYDSKGHVTSFQMLENQYPIQGEVTWAKLANP